MAALTLPLEFAAVFGLINEELEHVGCPPLNRSQFFRLRSVLIEINPQAEEILEGRRVLYASGFVRQIYYLARLHNNLRNYSVVAEVAKADLRGNFGQNFHHFYKSFSDINTRFLNHQNLADQRRQQRQQEFAVA